MSETNEVKSEIQQPEAVSQGGVLEKKKSESDLTTEIEVRPSKNLSCRRMLRETLRIYNVPITKEVILRTMSTATERTIASIVNTVDAQLNSMINEGRVSLNMGKYSLNRGGQF